MKDIIEQLEPGGRERADQEGQPTGSRERAAWGLTAREEEVLLLLAEGKSNKEIARALRISLDTAKSHVSRILHKLGVQTRIEAALLRERCRR